MHQTWAGSTTFPCSGALPSFLASILQASLYGARGIDGVQQIGVQDFSDGGFADARFMESYESRHSDHSFTASVVSMALVIGQ